MCLCKCSLLFSGRVYEVSEAEVEAEGFMSDMSFCTIASKHSSLSQFQHLTCFSNSLFLYVVFFLSLTYFHFQYIHSQNLCILFTHFIQDIEYILCKHCFQVSVNEVNESNNIYVCAEYA